MAHKSDLIAEDIHAYLKEQEHKSLLRFITCWSVDDGKSTLIGRLLYDSKMIFEDQLAALEADSKRVGTQGQDIDFALLVDGLAAEREQLLATLRDARRELSISFETATTDNLRKVLTMGTTALHWSGHGEESYMAFEDGSGVAHEITPSLPASTCSAGDDAWSMCRLVFVCACHSQPTAAAFCRAGVPHVVAVHSTALLLDAAAVCFTRHFLLSRCQVPSPCLRRSHVLRRRHHRSGPQHPHARRPEDVWRPHHRGCGSWVLPAQPCVRRLGPRRLQVRQ